MTKPSVQDIMKGTHHTLDGENLYTKVMFGKVLAGHSIDGRARKYLIKRGLLTKDGNALTYRGQIIAKQRLK